MFNDAIQARIRVAPNQRNQEGTSQLPAPTRLCQDVPDTIAKRRLRVLQQE